MSAVLAALVCNMGEGTRGQDSGTETWLACCAHDAGEVSPQKHVIANVHGNHKGAWGTCWPVNGDVEPLPCTADMGVVAVLQTSAGGGDCTAVDGGGCTAADGGCRPPAVSVWPSFRAPKLEAVSAVHVKSDAMLPLPLSCSDKVAAPVPVVCAGHRLQISSRVPANTQSPMRTSIALACRRTCVMLKSAELCAPSSETPMSVLVWPAAGPLLAVSTPSQLSSWMTEPPQTRATPSFGPFWMPFCGYVVAATEKPVAPIGTALLSVFAVPYVTALPGMSPLYSTTEMLSTATVLGKTTSMPSFASARQKPTLRQVRCAPCVRVIIHHSEAI